MKDPARRLVWTYPPGPRREEILDMLNQARGSGVAPSWRTRMNLLRHGMRARLGRPAGTGIVWVAVLVSLVTGFLFACAAEAVAWSAGPGVPDLRSVVSVVSAGQPVEEYRDSSMIVPGDGWRGYFTGADDEDRYGVQSVHQSLPAGTDPSQWLLTTRDRLEASGWQYRDSTDPSYDQSFMATRDGYYLQAGFTVLEERTSASVTVGRTMPGWMSVILVLAAVVGAFSGWLLTGWLSRRLEHRGQEERVISAIFTGIILALMVPLALLGLGVEVSNILSLSLPLIPPWILLFKVYFWVMFVASLAMTGFVVFMAMTGQARTNDAVARTS